MESMSITTAQYYIDILSNEVSSIQANINGVEMSVPLTEGNRHYDEIMRQVEAGELTIDPADEDEE